MPALGNHDTWVVEFEDFAKPNSNYEINHFKRYWNDWLGDEATDKLGEYGYYSVPISLPNGKAVPAGSKVIALNTQACNPTNFYIFGERSDPGNMFAWLEQELSDLEAAGGLAIIIGHYTPNQCQHQFGTRYRALIERYQHVVRFGLAGHVHTKFYELTQSFSNPGKPVMYTNVAPSVTPWQFMQPSFQVIDLDAETLLPLNIHTYYMDIAKANAEGHPTWEILDDVVGTWKTKDMSPSSMKDLAGRLLTDSDLAKDWVYYQSRMGAARPDEVDQVKLYCDLVSSEMWEKHECNLSGGTASPTFGKGFHWKNPQSWADWAISDWIKVGRRD